MIRRWKVIKRSQFFKKYSRVVEEVAFELPNGLVEDFYIKKEGPAVAVLGLTKNKEVVLVKQFRPGPLKTLLELPGGYVEDLEKAKDAIKREFLEETGYEGKFSFVGECLDDAYSTMVRYCYVAENCYRVADPMSSSTEQTEVVLMNLDKFRELLRSGQMTDVEVGYLCLDYLKLL